MFKDQVVLVTGGTRGIGRAISLEFAHKGAKLVVNYTSSEEKAKALVEELAAVGCEAIAVQADVSKAEDAERLTAEAVKKFGKIDVLVNNAGITRDNLIIRMKESDWDEVMNVNLKGAFLMSKAVGKLMLKARNGVMVNLTSVVGIMGNAGQSNYSASKAGVIGLTKSLAREFAPRGVRVNAVAPGYILTDMTSVLSEDATSHFTSQIPLGRAGTPEDVAKVVSFLCSQDSAYLTGQVIHVDGGMLI
ncbi:3-oxoacyl-[acyl-carrier-protein] reductase [Acidaminobacter sp.]|uniref:3-oxoacyl-[acyl-carrier-protein] reductase n=1 Tax=Acidaminobacter sp. TaxID=1872102 RepID=UPI00137F6531|nr:3-oxoacyl-[acyl-carrier-protein] reductase [Acidaminobacter sp.]MDK9709605.1 3-oxoacyl-[acyl-carrier-protein] reductase [Acidaminobacter sp.]MZQ96483.1 3-oxoacyl-[acyl-carrier-protein] reductase [Acidaminobacter sp.]